MVRRTRPSTGRIRASGDRVDLRQLTPADRAEFVASVQDSVDILHPWVHPPADRRSFNDLLHRARQPDHVVSLVVRRDSTEIVGACNLNNLVRGNFSSAYIGYYGFRPHVGHGLLTEGVRLTIEYAFGELGLHRVEANIQPANHRSIRLARRCGFRLEGFSPGYLYIDGAWRDHERWAIVRQDWKS